MGYLFSYPTNFTVTRFAKHNNARNTHRSFDHEFDPSIRHSYNHRHALPRACKLQNVQYLVTLFSTHLHHCIHTTDFPQHTGSLCSLIQILHDDLHWLDVADRVTYKLGVIMHRCRHGKAPQYLVDCCTPVTNVVGRQRLRSATQQLTVVPRHRLSTVGTPCRTTSAHSRTMSPVDRG